MGVGSFKNLLLQNHRTRLGINHPGGRGFKLLQMKGVALLEGEAIAKKKVKIH